jgi:hypothetical protein
MQVVHSFVALTYFQAEITGVQRLVSVRHEEIDLDGICGAIFDQQLFGTFFQDVEIIPHSAAPTA